MSIPGASTTGGTTNTGSTGSSTTATSAAAVQSQYQQFLKILTTELKNQDPTSPLDTNQFTSQLVQFSQLEQNLNTNSLLQTLVNNQSQSAIGNALGYMGHTIQATGNSFAYDGTHSNTLTYSLASNAAKAVITVSDASGKPVAQFNADATSGQHTATFNGTGTGGSSLGAGTYTFAVQATDSSGTAVAATTYMTGTVTGIDNSGGAVTLHLGSQTVPASSVVQVTS